MNLKRKPLITNIIWNFTSFFANLLVSFFLARFILGQIGSVKYGIWVLVGSFLSYAGLMDLGISTAIVQRIAGSVAKGNREEIQDIITTATSLFSLIGLLVFLVCFLFSAIDASLFNIPLELGENFSFLLIILGGGVGFSFLGRVHLGILRALERFDIVNIIILIQICFQVLFIVLFLKHSILVLGIIYASLNIAVNLSYMIAAKMLLPDYRFASVNFNRSTIQSLGVYGFFAFLIMLADRFRFYTDSFVIGHFLGAGAITTFYFGNRLVEYSRNVIAPMASPFLSLFSRYERTFNQKDSQEAFFRLSRITALLSFLVCGFLIGAGYPFLTLWIGERIDSVRSSYIVLLILSVPSTIDVAQIVSVNLLYGINRHKYLSYLTMSEGLVNLILSILFVRFFGIYGVALGTALPMLVTKGFYQPMYVCAQVGIRPLHYFKKCLLMPLIFGAFVLGLQLSLFQVFQNIRWLHVLAVSVLSAVCVCPFIYFLFFSKEEKDWIGLSYRNWSRR